MREDVYPFFRGVECSDENLKIESDGTLSFDGFRWMGGRNNQPKVILSDGILLGEAARRAITMGDDAVTSFRPSS